MVAVAAVWVFVGLVMIGTGALVIGIAHRTADGRMGRNAWAGTRTKATRSSEAAWRAAHQAGLGPSIVAGWIFIAAGVVSPVLAWLIADEPDPAMAWWGGLVTAFALAGSVVLVLGALRSQRAAKDVNEGFPTSL